MGKKAKQPAHAKYSASGAERWMKCPASIKAEAGLPDSESEFAFEGTCAHFLAELVLTTGDLASNHVGDTLTLDEDSQSKEFGSEFKVTQEMAEYVQQYVDYCNALPGQHFVEERLNYSNWVTGGFGTGDFIAYDVEHSKLYVTDLKYGRGVKKMAEDNPQLMLYALGAMNDFSWLGEINHVETCIHQPRLDHVDVHAYTRSELILFGEKAKAAEIKTKKKNPKFVPGEAQCKFCKARTTDDPKRVCKAYDEYVPKHALDGFNIMGDKSIMEAKPVESVPANRYAKILEAEKMFKDWIAGIKAQALKMCLEGDPPPGLKVVHGRRPNKKWTIADELIEQKLKNAKVPARDTYVKKVITPAAAIKLLGETHPVLKKYVEQGEGAPTVVPAEDKRPAIDVEAEAVEGFESVPS